MDESGVDIQGEDEDSAAAAADDEMVVPSTSDPVPEEISREEKIKELQAQKAVFMIANAEPEYGPFQRMAISAIDINPQQKFHVEKALLYISAGVEPPSNSGSNGEKMEADTAYFTSGGTFPRVPAAFLKLHGALYVYMTCLLIKNHEEKSRMFLGLMPGVEGLFGRINDGICATPLQAFPIFQEFFHSHFNDSEKREFWTLRNFGLLLGIVQVNAVVGRMPLRNGCFGIGLFPGACFINHSCAPNAVRIMVPGRLYIQALRPIKEGDEITVAYQEFPQDLLDNRMCMFLQDQSLHFRCKCEVCTMIGQASAAAEAQNKATIKEMLKESKKDEESIQEPEEEEEKYTGDTVDLSKDPFTELWEDDVRVKMEADKRLRSMVTQFIHKAHTDAEGGKLAAAAAFVLRTQYAHLLTPPEEGKPPLDYCGGLAYILGDIFCSSVMHHPDTHLDDVEWWPKIWMGALSQSVVDMPVTTCRAILACTYSGILKGFSRAIPPVINKEKDSDEEQRVKQQEIDALDALKAGDFELFLANWLALRSLHNSVFGHTAFMVTDIYSHETIHHSVTTSKAIIRKLEITLALDSAREESEAILAAQKAEKQVEVPVGEDQESSTRREEEDK